MAYPKIIVAEPIVVFICMYGKERFGSNTLTFQDEAQWMEPKKLFLFAYISLAHFCFQFRDPV